MKRCTKKNLTLVSPYPVSLDFLDFAADTSGQVRPQNWSHSLRIGAIYLSIEVLHPIIHHREQIEARNIRENHVIIRNSISSGHGGYSNQLGYLPLLLGNVFVVMDHQINHRGRRIKAD
jgi:hypothetical protein